MFERSVAELEGSLQVAPQAEIGIPPRRAAPLLLTLLSPIKEIISTFPSSQAAYADWESTSHGTYLKLNPMGPTSYRTDLFWNPQWNLMFEPNLYESDLEYMPPKELSLITHLVCTVKIKKSSRKMFLTSSGLYPLFPPLLVVFLKGRCFYTSSGKMFF